MNEGGMIWHGYVLVELAGDQALALTPGARQAIRAALATLNRPWDGVHPARRFQARSSLDGRSAIYELTADLGSVTPEHAIAVVADALQVASPALRRAIRFTFFAPGGTWQQSQRAARHYLAQHHAAWEGGDTDA